MTWGYKEEKHRQGAKPGSVIGGRKGPRISKALHYLAYLAEEKRLTNDTKRSDLL